MHLVFKYFVRGSKDTGAFRRRISGSGGVGGRLFGFGAGRCRFRRSRDRALIGVGTASGYREYRKRQLLSRRWVLSFLKARGLDPEEDADGDVLFLLDNMKYVLHIKEHYFELHIGFGRKRSELNDELMTRMAQEVMSSTRMVKILLRPEAVLFSIECLQCRKSEFAGFFDSYIRILKFSVAEHTRRYNEALEEFHRELRRQREAEYLSQRFSDYQGKDVVN